MALTADLIWEVRTSGNDANGGAFKAGASGTDYSQQDAAQITYSDLVIDATTNTKLTSAAAPFSALHVGNVINITSGTGFTVGRYQVISVAAAVATCDRAVGTLSSTGGNGSLGGALLTLGTLSGVMIASNKAWVKSGTYGLSTALTFAQTVTPAYNVPPSRLFGYATTRGDITPTSANQSSRPNLQSNGTLTSLLQTSGAGWVIRNLQVSLGTGTITKGIHLNGQNSTVLNCKVSGSSAIGIHVFHISCMAQFCEVTAMTGGIGISSDQGQNQVVSCYVHDSNASTLIGISSSGPVSGCIVANLTGTSSKGIVTPSGAALFWNTVYNCAGDGISLTVFPYGTIGIRGNLITNCGGYGLTCSAGSGTPASPEWDGNAFYFNGIANRNNLDDVSGVNASGPHTNIYDVALSVSPFTNAGSGDFSLNNTAGGGAACRGVAPLNTWPVLTQIGYRDFGAIQHQDAGGGGVTVFFMEG